MPTDAPNDAVQRFARSMQIDYEKWHDGIGYDLDTLAAATPQEREAIEDLLLARPPGDWRDVEALARLDTPRARAALDGLLAEGPVELRLAVVRHRAQPVPDAQHCTVLVQALEHAEFHGGLTQALDTVAEFHPPPVVDALWRGLAARAGPVAVHFAAMLALLHGLTDSSFDMAMRPFFLRFHCPRGAERDAAIAELRQRIAAHTAPPAGDK